MAEKWTSIYGNAMGSSAVVIANVSPCITLAEYVMLSMENIDIFKNNGM